MSIDAVRAVAKVVLGPTPAYEKLAALSAGYGVRLSPEQYHDEVVHIALQAHRMVRWVNFGMPTYLLDKDTAAMLALTDVDRLKQDEVRFPFPTFLIVLDPGSPIYMDEDGSVREVRYIWVHHFERPDGGLGLLISASHNLEGVSLPSHFAYQGKEVGDWVHKASGVQTWGALKITDIDREANAAVLRLVVSLAMHIQRERPKRARPRHHVSDKVLGRHELPMPTDWVPAKIRIPADIKAALREGGARVQGKLTARHVVRGHWRQQAHGRGRQLRKPTWIAPHWRGTGAEAVAGTVRPRKRQKKNPSKSRDSLRRLMRLG
jgi:hypothetical protein